VLEPLAQFEPQVESRVQRASPPWERPLRAAEPAVALQQPLPESEALPEAALVSPLETEVQRQALPPQGAELAEAGPLRLPSFA
jgi:hypothetical protein